MQDIEVNPNDTEILNEYRQERLRLLQAELESAKKWHVSCM